MSRINVTAVTLEGQQDCISFAGNDSDFVMFLICGTHRDSGCLAGVSMMSESSAAVLAFPMASQSRFLQSGWRVQGFSLVPELQSCRARGSQ